MVGVSKNWDVHLAESSMLAWLVDPCQVREDRVGRSSENNSVDGVELSSTVRKSDNLSWAHESEVEWVEEKNNIFSLVVRERDIHKLSVNDGLSLELWGWLANECLRHLKDRNNTLHGT